MAQLQVMENIRPRMLPRGWYPDQPQNIASFIESSSLIPGRPKGISCIVPHAGWAFSGKLAAAGIGTLKDADLIVLMGGHLGPGSRVMRLVGDAYETPLGNISADTGFINFLSDRINVQATEAPDNTTEVLFPFLRYFFPDTPVAALRIPSGPVAALAGKAAAEYSAVSGRKLVVAGSTDLTHYGTDYGFTPRGTGLEAYRWVTEVNDRAFIEASLRTDWRGMINCGEKNRAACSSGAAAAAAVFARETATALGREPVGELLGYSTSREAAAGKSLSGFVGYSAILFR